MNKIILDFKNVSLKLQNSEKEILSNINYQVLEGSFIIILGSNGSGKSSLLKLIDKRYMLTGGEILLDGKPIHTYSNKSFPAYIKTLTQNCHESLFLSLTLIENYFLVKKNRFFDIFNFCSEKEIKEIKYYFSLFNPNLSSKLNEVVFNLSGGEKQALALALTLLYPPRILLLDEHTSALDPKSAKNIMQLTKNMAEKHGITCILTTHHIEEALTYGTHILALKDRKVYRTFKNTSDLSAKILFECCY